MRAFLAGLALAFHTMADLDSEVDDSKIVGGFEIDLHHVPFLVSVQVNGNHICGGAILTVSHVITGCHCLGEADLGMTHKEIQTRPTNKLTVVVGTENIAKPSKQMQRRSISNIKLHPNCSYYQILLFDFALGYLRKPLIETVKVKPLRMVSLNRDAFDKATTALVGDHRRFCYVAGWGSTAIDPKGGHHRASPVLKAARMIVIPDAVCREKLGTMNYKYEYFDFAGSGQLCSLSYGHQMNESDCRGDSGGPFFCGSRVYGVISYGYECGQWDTPNVYAKLSYAVDWLVTLKLKGLRAYTSPDDELTPYEIEKQQPRALQSSQASSRELTVLTLPIMLNLKSQIEF